MARRYTLRVMKDYSLYRYAEIEKKLDLMGLNFLDILVTGVTGAGKSTTLNSFFHREVAKVGTGVDPETMKVAPYYLGRNLRFWDTPGLGDSPAADQRHIEKITRQLQEQYQCGEETYEVIDLVLVILDGSTRDMNTNDILLNKVLIPHIHQSRILVAINQADFAMKGRHWNAASATPDRELLAFLEDKARSIQRRVQKSTGIEIPLPVCYSAKYGYHVDRLFDLMIDNIPNRKRRGRNR